ncbi:putative nucleoside-diphosphate kinase [Arabidopsis thaliana]|uniref:Nucleoside diphosphate kinase n=1 Tax=Arabidopsis thaliana TaxID=3702 RepID=A0A5S9XV87_ARATH|nr:unnamed protein product [Arabidopsis thaliana]VYS63710.1 unnamed protein product [Arabidopsis thaliana]
MDDGTPKKLNILPDHFSAPSPTAESSQHDTPSSSQPKDDSSLRSYSQSRTRRNLKRAATMLNLFTLRRLPWVSDGQEKVELSAAELESLRSELSDMEEREAYLKAQLEHVDEVLRSARLSGYLFIRSRWAALPGEPPPIDDTEVDDWLPRFVVLQGPCLFFYLLSTDLSPQDSTLLADIVEIGSVPSYTREFDETHYCFYILTRQGLRFECSSTSKTQVDSWLSVLRLDCKSEPEERSASRAARSLLSSAKNARFFSEGRAIGAASVVHATGKVPQYASNFGKSGSGFVSNSWITGLLALPAAAFMLQDQEALAAEMERTFIAIKPDGVQRGLISEIITRFERKGYKLVGIKVMVPSKGFAQKHYHDLKERPFFNGLCNFLSSGPVVAMVWEGEGVIRYGRKLIGATDPQKSEPGTIRGDLAVVVGRNIIHGSDGPETAKDEISLWFKPEELVSYTSNAEKWIYGQN